MKKNQGFTLIEMIVSLAILAIVGLILVSFISISTKTFRSLNTEVDIQYESQLTVNQLKDLIMDSNRGITYGLQPVVGNFSVVDLENQNSESTILANLEGADVSNVGKVKRCLLIYNQEYTAATDTYKYPVIKIVWDPVTGQLNYGKKTFSDLTSLEADKYLNSLTTSDYSLMSEYTDNFSINMINTADKTISLSLSLADAGKDYSTTPTISLRNKVIVSDDISSIYESTNIVRQSLINGVSIKKAGTVISADSVSVGATVQYDAVVAVQFGASTGSDSVQWSLSGNRTYGTGAATSISQTGKLIVSPYELSSQITITAVSTVDQSKKSSVIINVQNIKGEFGYVNFLTLGNVTTGDIIAPTSPNGPYEYYGVTFDNTSSYISYVNGDKLTSAQKGVTWTVTTNAPSNSYTWGVFPTGTTSYGLTGSPIYIKTYYGAMNYTFQINATTNTEDYSGNKITATKVFTVSGMQQPIAEITPTIDFTANSLTLSRNGKITLTKDVQNVVSPTYTWEIDTASGTGFSTTVANKYASNVYTTLLSSGNEEVYAKTQMDWNTDFTFKVRLHVTGFTNKGNPVDKTIEKTITVPKVVATVSPTTATLNFSSNLATVSTTVSYANLNVGSAGIIDTNYYPTFQISSVNYIYYDYWSTKRTVPYSTGYITYSNNIMTLSKTMMSDINSKYSWYGSGELDYNLAMNGSSNVLTQLIKYTIK